MYRNYPSSSFTASITEVLEENAILLMTAKAGCAVPCCLTYTNLARGIVCGTDKFCETWIYTVIQVCGTDILSVKLT